MRRKNKYPLRPQEDASELETEKAALLGKPCPPGGNPFTAFFVSTRVCSGSEPGRTIWERHRKQVLEERDFLPGTRPEGWWQYDAPPGRPQRWEVDSAFPSHNQSPKATQRAQATWLAARGLLTSAERKALPAEWFQSKPKLVIT